MLLNPFLEGIILIVLGIVGVVVAHAINDQELKLAVASLIPLGIGYMGGHAVANANNKG